MEVPDRPQAVPHWSSRWREWAESQDIRRYEDTLLLVLTLLIGATVGLAVVAFILLTERLGVRLGLAGGPAWHRLAVPVAGALASGLLLVWLFPNARGSGIPQTKTALQLEDGFISLRTVIGKFVCSSMALACGMALGREGPTVQVGAGIASVLGRRLGLGPRRVRALLPIGTAAALAAAFNTPISAVLFTLEEILGDLHAPVLGSIVISSATSWAVLHLVLGDEPLFHVPAYQLVHPSELPIYAVLGVVGGLVAVAFVKLLLGLRRGFLALPARTRWAQPAVGGLVVGLLGYAVPGVLGVGYGYVGEALNGQLLLTTMALYLGLKLVATASCYASGNAGGIFGPSLFIGAMLGGSVGGVAHAWFPDTTGSAGAYALVGMGTAFAGIVRAPMTSVIMIFEITRDYSIIVPLMIANLLAYFISQRLQPTPVYDALLEQDHVRLPATRPHITLATVEQAMRPPHRVLDPNEPVDQALGWTGEGGAREDALPVVANGTLLGMIHVDALRGAVGLGDGRRPVRDLLPALQGDLSPESFPHVFLDHPADVALQRMGRSGLHVLPVVSRSNPRNLLGIVRLEEMPAAFARADGPRASVSTRRSETSVRTLLTVVLVAVCGLFLLGLILARHYYTDRAASANNAYEAGRSLLGQGRAGDAIERFRTALSLDSRREYRVALGLALAGAGRGPEATPYLEDIVRLEPRHGAANLAIARLAVSRGDTATALDAYRRAVAGTWAPGEQDLRRDAAMELAALLYQSGDARQAIGILLQAASQDASPSTLKRIGREFLTYGAPAQAADVFRQALQATPRDPELHAGLGDAALARGDLRAAESAYATALTLSPGSDDLRRKRDAAARLAALDPTLPRLSVRARWDRSRALLTQVIDVASACSSTAPHESQTAMLEKARRTIAGTRPPKALPEATDALQEDAMALWRQISPDCQTGPRSELAHVMARLEP